MDNLVVIATADQPVCFGTAVNFRAAVQGRPYDTFDYQWDFDYDGANFVADITTTDHNVSFEYNYVVPPDFKQVKVIVSAPDGSCSGEETMLVQIRTVSTATLQTVPDPPTICQGDSIDFSGFGFGQPPTSGWQYAWDWEDDGIMDNLEQNPTKVWLDPGIFQTQL